MKETVGEVFGERMREIRQKAGMTQVELAERSGLAQTRVSELERGVRSPNLATVVRLALALDCKVSALVAGFDRRDLASILSE
ncbi:MAG TPA: helix-turn-helix transcriptional regulator [Thermoanaerobaculia bacterium]